MRSVLRRELNIRNHIHHLTFGYDVSAYDQMQLARQLHATSMQQKTTGVRARSLRLERIDLRMDKLDRMAKQGRY